MKFVDLDYITILQIGKLVKFKKYYLGENLSNLLTANNFHKAKIDILPGSFGRVYQVRLGTLFIGFGKELSVPPPLYNSPTMYSTCVVLNIDDVEKIQFEE